MATVLIWKRWLTGSGNAKPIETHFQGCGFTFVVIIYVVRKCISKEKA
jgi:hypothetical protein